MSEATKAACENIIIDMLANCIPIAKSGEKRCGLSFIKLDCLHPLYLAGLLYLLPLQTIRNYYLYITGIIFQTISSFLTPSFPTVETPSVDITTTQEDALRWISGSERTLKK